MLSRPRTSAAMQSTALERPATSSLKRVSLHGEVPGFFFAAIAQLAAHRSSTSKVAGSSPVRRSSAPVAQWIRAAGFYPVGREFESFLARHQLSSQSLSASRPASFFASTTQAIAPLKTSMALASVAAVLAGPSARSFFGSALKRCSWVVDGVGFISKTVEWMQKILRHGATQRHSTSFPTVE